MEGRQIQISYFTKVIISFVIMISIVTGVCAFAANGIVNVDALNVRSGPSYDNGIITTVAGGTVLNVVDGGNGWYTLDFNGGAAYVVAQYVDLQPEEAAQAAPAGDMQYYEAPWYGKVAASALNVRAEASFSSRVVRTLNSGYKVEVRGEQGDFYIIENGEWDAFVAKEYIAWISEEEYNAPAASGADAVVALAMQYIGTPYAYGGSSPSGFDCSGFTSYVYAQFGVSLSRTAAGQANNGTWVAKSDLVPGDLVLFGPYSGGGIGHAGIYIGDGNMIHSPKPGRTVCVESIYSNYYASRYVQARRII